MPFAARLAFSPLRRKPRIIGTLLVLVLGHAPRAAAEQRCPDSAPWSRLGQTGAHLLRPLPVALTALAVAAPFAFAPSGLDHDLRLVAQRDLPGKPKLEPVSVWTPYVLGAGLVSAYAIAAATDSCSTKRFLSPLLQAGFVTYLSVGVLKFGVGRRWPNGGADPNAPDRLQHPEYARTFTPFQNLFGAWPSGHTAILFAGASAFRASNPDFGLGAWLGYPLALGVATGMWLGDHHWASDIVSGAFLGEAIGSSVGQSFSDALGVPGAVVLASPGGNGIGAQWFYLW